VHEDLRIRRTPRALPSRAEFGLHTPGETQSLSIVLNQRLFRRIQRL
jgi:hypothetical protein